MTNVEIGSERNHRKSLNDGWLHVERSMSDQLDSYVTENTLSFSGGWMEVRQFSWREPTENLWRTDRRCYLLNMSLMNRQTTTLASSLTERRIEGETVGRTFMVPPDQTMRCNNMGKGQARSIRCALDADLVESFMGDAPDKAWKERALRDALHLSGGQIEWLLRRMYREVQDPDFATVPVIEALAKQLAVEIIRKFDLRAIDARHHAGGIAPWRMNLIRKRLHSIETPPALAELAELCNMTVRHLSRAFRTETGQTLGRYIEATMVERATAMLSADTSVSEVARALGYSSSGSFATAIRRATGFRPSEIKLLGNKALRH
jgi:AraC family transcriptional regulator